jgi:hypothetical protein
LTSIDDRQDRLADVRNLLEISTVRVAAVTNGRLLCHAQALGLAGTTGSGTENPERPEGCFAFSVPAPFFSERLNPNFSL